MSLCLHRLIQLAALIHLVFHENEICGVRHILDIIRQLCPGALEKTGVFKHDQTALRKKGQRLRQVNHLPDVNILPLIMGIVHGIAVRKHCLNKPVPVLPLQISLLAVEKVDLFKLSCLKIFIQAFHNFSII